MVLRLQPEMQTGPGLLPVQDRPLANPSSKIFPAILGEKVWLVGIEPAVYHGIFFCLYLVSYLPPPTASLTLRSHTHV